MLELVILSILPKSPLCLSPIHTLVGLSESPLMNFPLLEIAFDLPAEICFGLVEVAFAVSEILVEFSRPTL